MSRVTIFFAALLAGLAVSAPATAQLGGSDFLRPGKAFSYHVTANDDDTLKIVWDIAPGYYLYRDQFKFEGEPEAVARNDLPKGEQIHDDYFGESEIYRDKVTTIVHPGNARTVALTWQGCADAGLCYPPQHATLELSDYGAGGGEGGASNDVAAASPEASREPALGEDQSLANRLAGVNVPWMLAVFFGFGLLLVFTPCVLPMLPILTSLIVGSGARGWRGFLLSVTYVLTMAATYAVLGVAAALAGANLQATLQTPWVLGAFAVLFVALALSMFGVYEFSSSVACGPWACFGSNNIAAGLRQLGGLEFEILACAVDADMTDTGHGNLSHSGESTFDTATEYFA